MLIYLDNCMFNRPFDNQEQIRIRLETEAKLHIQDLIKQQQLSLVWSYILSLENAKNPFFDKQFAIEKWHFLASVVIEQNEEIIQRAESFIELGIRVFDSLHLSCAIEANADCFLTTDDKFLKKIQKYDLIKVANPIDFIREI